MEREGENNAQKSPFEILIEQMKELDDLKEPPKEKGDKTEKSKNAFDAEKVVAEILQEYFRQHFPIEVVISPELEALVVEVVKVMVNVAVEPRLMTYFDAMFWNAFQNSKGDMTFTCRSAFVLGLSLEAITGVVKDAQARIKPKEGGEPQEGNQNGEEPPETC